jgi:exonuclease VII large subunit
LDASAETPLKAPISILAQALAREREEQHTASAEIEDRIRQHRAHAKEQQRHYRALAERTLSQLESGAATARRSKLKDLEAQLDAAETALRDEHRHVLAEQHKSAELIAALQVAEQRYALIKAETDRHGTEAKENTAAQMKALAVERARVTALERQLELVTDAANMLREAALTKAYEMDRMLLRMGGVSQTRDSGKRIVASVADSVVEARANGGGRDDVWWEGPRHLR